jgi:DNA-binding NtrC family response regulator
MNNDIKTLMELEKEHIMYAMDMFGRNKPKVAEVLGISLKTLYNKLNSYGQNQIQSSVGINPLIQNTSNMEDK